MPKTNLELRLKLIFITTLWFLYCRRAVWGFSIDSNQRWWTGGQWLDSHSNEKKLRLTDQKGTQAVDVIVSPGA